MVEKMRLTPLGKLEIVGEVNERLPIITDGLVAHFPFDGTIYPYFKYSASLSGISTDGIGDLFVPVDNPVFSDYEGMYVNGNSTCYLRTSYPSASDVAFTRTDSLIIKISVKPTELRTGAICSSTAGYNYAMRYSYSIRYNSNGTFYAKVEAYAKNPTEYHNNGWGIGVTSTNTFGINSWYDIRIEYNKTTLKLFVNDVLEGTVAALGDVSLETFPGSGIFVTYSQKDLYSIPAWSGWFFGADGATTNNASHITNVSNDPNAKVPAWSGVANFKGYIRNFELTKSSAPTTNTNTTMTYDGIAVEEATTNYVTNGDFSDDLSGWSLSGGKGNSVNKVVYFQGKICLFQDVGYYNVSDYYLQNFTLPANTECTVSFMLYLVDGGFRFDPNGTWNTGILYNSSNTEMNKWVKITKTFTTTATTSETFHLYGDSTNRGVYYITDMQVEAKSFATSFVNGSRAYSHLAIPTSDYWDNSFSMFAWTKVPSTTGWRMLGGAWAKWYFSWYSGSTTTLLFSWVDSTQKSSSATITGTDCRDWNYIGFTYDKPSQILKIYINGVLASTKTSVNLSAVAPTTTAIGNISNGSTSYVLNGKVKDYTIYNRALSDYEAKLLVNSHFNPQTNGDLIIRKIIEKPSIPDSVYYFPLGADDKDEYKNIVASEASNLIYKDGSVWVGNAITNQADEGDISPYIGYSTFFWSSDVITRVQTDTNGYLVMRSTPLYPEQGKTLAISGYMYLNGIPTDYKASSSSRFSTYNGYVTSEMKSNPTTGYFEGIVTISPSAANGFLFHSPTYAVTIGDIITIRNLQIEEKIFITPYVKTSNPQSSLEYNLNASIGLNWSGNWSIMYWKKPMATANNLLTSYNIESFGCNSNSVGGGYNWWGKNSGFDSVGMGAFDAVDIGKYFGNWHFVSIVKSGTIITWKFYLSDGQVITKTTTNSTTVANFYVTQYGYDLKLGGWDNIYVCNAYFKDLVVAKYALSDSEISNIMNNNMNIHSDKIQISNQLQEGAIL